MPVFIANVPAPLKVGDRIEIGGKIKENARKMSVNLCAQEGEEPRDVVLHFDVRFHRDNIISLSRKNGVWIGSGNYDTNYNMFVPGTIFRIIFEIKDTDVITIYCQGKFHSNFLPKIPLAMAKYIVAWADVERITHCYFHFNPKVPVSEELQASAFSNQVSVQRPATACAASGEPKRGHSHSHSHRPRKKATDSVKAASSDETSADEAAKARPKAEGRADRFFYETLMCQPQERKFGSPDMSKLRREAGAHNSAEFGRRYKAAPLSDSEKNYSDGDDYSEELSKIDSSVDTDAMPDLAMQKRMRRSKFPFAQVVNFMGKRERRC